MPPPACAGAKAARDKRIFDLWLACHTQEEIAAEVDAERSAISMMLPKMAELPNLAKPAADHLTEFETAPRMRARSVRPHGVRSLPPRREVLGVAPTPQTRCTGILARRFRRAGK